MNQNFRVADGSKAMPLAFQFLVQLAIVVDFAVEHDLDGAVFVPERLMSARQIDDRESAVAESGAIRSLLGRRNPDSTVIGAAMAENVGHPAQRCRVDRAASF